MEIEVVKNIVKALLEVMEESQLTTLSVEEKGLKIELKKEGAVPSVVSPQLPGFAPLAPAMPMQPQAPLTAPASKASVSEAKEEKKDEDEGLIAITSPMVGTFYRAPSPESPPFVEVGDEVRVGQVVCIVEAMKLFNEIETEVSGKVVKVLAENANPVEYGQKLILIKPA